MIGEIVVIAAVVAIAFFSGRSTLRSIRAELRGEGTCAGCSGGCAGAGGSCADFAGGSVDFAGAGGSCAGCGKTGEACCTCMRQMEELQKVKESKKRSN